MIREHLGYISDHAVKEQVVNLPSLNLVPNPVLPVMFGNITIKPCSAHAAA